jgi:hypothetical protein
MRIPADQLAKLDRLVDPHELAVHRATGVDLELVHDLLKPAANQRARDRAERIARARQRRSTGPPPADR